MSHLGPPAAVPPAVPPAWTDSPGSPALTGPPPPPPGPGVQPPFAAPPTDGKRQRRWLAVGLAGGLALLLCLGGVVGVGGILVLGTQVVREQAVTALTDYLTAIKDHEYRQAYGLLCPSEQMRHSFDSFSRDLANDPQITQFTVGEAQLANDILVPATIRYSDRSVDTITYVMAQNAQTGGVEVCGEAD